MSEDTNKGEWFSKDNKTERELRRKLADTHHKGFLRIKELKDNSLKDELTGLFNLRGWNEQAEKIVSLMDRTNTTLGILVIDIDNLKKINDEKGHDQGSKAIIEVANAIHKSAGRKSDIAARWGGDEFGVLLPNADKEEVKKVVSKIRDNLTLTSGGDISVSIGVAIKNPIESFKDAFSMADKNMYLEKYNKKNNV